MLGCTLQNLLARPIWLSRSVHPSHKQITGEKIPFEQAEVCLEEPIFFSHGQFICSHITCQEQK